MLEFIIMVLLVIIIGFASNHIPGKAIKRINELELENIRLKKYKAVHEDVVTALNLLCDKFNSTNSEELKQAELLLRSLKEKGF